MKSKKKVTTSRDFSTNIGLFSVSFLTFFLFFSIAIAADTTSTADPSPENQEKVKDVQDDIDNLSKKLEKAQREKSFIERNLAGIQNSLSVTNNAINKTKSLLAETTDVIRRKELEVQLLEENIQLKKEILSDLMQEIYFSSDISSTEILFGDEDFSDETDQSRTIQDITVRVKTLLDDIQNLKEKTEDEKSNLQSIKKENERVLAEKAVQQKALAGAQAETQADLKEQEATIAEIQQKLNKLKNELSSLLGSNVSTNDVMEAAAIASRATGVRKAFILGELTQESGLGRFTGGCYYKNTRVKEADKIAFKKIMDELGYDVNKKKISCSPGFGYGGAMGIAQFMPTTWMGYKKQISSMTGHKPPDPWNVVDGVTGMAIKLAAGGATTKSGEFDASRRYYCGGPSSPYWNNKCRTYAQSVQRLAAGYEK